VDNHGRVHVVDDDRSVRQAIETLLNSVGIPAVQHESAEAFLSSRDVGVTECLVLDVRMPGMSGLDLVEAMRARGWDIPVVFITGHGDVPMSVRAMKQGAVDFLQKPFNDQELLDAVRRALEASEVRREERRQSEEIQVRISSLTPRELEVMKLIVEGYSSKEVGRILGAAENTIKIHRSRVMRKMEATSLPDLVRLAALAGDPESA